MHPFAKLIPAPVLLVGIGGEILEMNAQARTLFGGEVSHLRQVFENGEELRALLKQASGSAEPVIGALDILPPSDPIGRVRVNALALRQSETLQYAISLQVDGQDRFAVLTDRVRELNLEIGVRRRAQAMLEESLRNNQTLYRELNHRVKNHLQMVLALVSSSRRENADPAHQQFVLSLEAKLSALFDAQRLMYGEQSGDGMPADQLLRAIADTCQTLAGVGAEVELNLESTIVANDVAFPLALITNELLTNAMKYGRSGEGVRVQISLSRRGGDAVLEIRDQGPGFSIPASSRKSSGLGLVRGLCRQIGGRLDIISDDGVLARVTFPHPEAAHDAS